MRGAAEISSLFPELSRGRIERRFSCWVAIGSDFLGRELRVAGGGVRRWLALGESGFIWGRVVGELRWMVALLLRFVEREGALARG